MAESHMFPAIGLLGQRFSEEIETFACLVHVVLLSHPCSWQVKLLLFLGLVVLRLQLGRPFKAEALKATGLSLL